MFCPLFSCDGCRREAMKWLWLFFLVLLSACSSSVSVEDRVAAVAEEYAVPAWFLLALVERESSFQGNLLSLSDGIGGEESWQSFRPGCGVSPDGYPHGVGLTQLTGWMYQGMPYPFCLEEPGFSEEYYYAMRMQDYGEWISMEDVSVLTDPFDYEQNLERFLTGYAIPAHDLFASLYPEDSEEEIWRRVAFHWNKGLYVPYDSENEDYLLRYDMLVEKYRL